MFKFIIQAILFTLGFASLAAAQSQNILVIVADDFGVDSLGAYGEGAAPAPTPNIDALAADGVLFRNASANAVCSPTRACIQTGRYGFRTGVGEVVGAQFSEGLPLYEFTIPEMLDAGGSGYAHACIGKWHLADAANGGDSSPNMAGYDHFAGLIGGGVNNYSTWQRTVNGFTQTSFEYSTTRMVDDTLSWINSTSQPWFCVLNFNAPHAPFHAPPASLHTQNLAGLNPATDPVPFYKAMVEVMDSEIGRLLATLGTELDDTNVIFMGDNGTPNQVSEPPFLSNHAKGTPFEGGTNVPLIVSGPVVVSPGREELALVHAVDVFSTVLDLAGVVEPDFVHIDGRSFLPYLVNPSQAALRDALFSEAFEGPAGGSLIDSTGFAAARDAQFKFFRRHQSMGTMERFFDLSVDPFETNNLLNGPMNSTQQAALQTLVGLIDDLRHPHGTAIPYGASSCAGSNGVPSITIDGIPSLGSTYTIELSSAPAFTSAILFTGLSNTGWMGIPLPLDLEPFGGGTGCALHASGESRLTLFTDVLGATSLGLPIPNHPIVLDAELFHSWLIYDPALGAAVPFTSSSGMAVKIGE